MFKTGSDDFELAWDGWIFTEDSEDLDEFTNRDYSELDFPFENEEFNGDNDLPILKLNRK